MNSQHHIRAGDYYLVDLGRLVRVPAANPRAACGIAVTEFFCERGEFPVVDPLVYQLSPSGDVMAVYE